MTDGSGSSFGLFPNDDDALALDGPRRLVAVVLQLVAVAVCSTRVFCSIARDVHVVGTWCAASCCHLFGLLLRQCCP